MDKIIDGKRYLVAPHNEQVRVRLRAYATPAELEVSERRLQWQVEHPGTAYPESLQRDLMALNLWKPQSKKDKKKELAKKKNQHEREQVARQSRPSAQSSSSSAGPLCSSFGPAAQSTSSSAAPVFAPPAAASQPAPDSSEDENMDDFGVYNLELNDPPLPDPDPTCKNIIFFRFSSFCCL